MEDWLNEKILDQACKTVEAQINEIIEKKKNTFQPISEKHTVRVVFIHKSFKFPGELLSEPPVFVFCP